MNEVKQPKKPLLIFYIVMLVLMLLFNMFVVPAISKQQINEVDYGTFMTMTENGEIGKVEVRSNMILFTDKADPPKIYRTGIMNDPGLTERVGVLRVHELVGDDQDGLHGKDPLKFGFGEITGCRKRLHALRPVACRAPGDQALPLPQMADQFGQRG